MPSFAFLAYYLQCKKSPFFKLRVYLAVICSSVKRKKQLCGLSLNCSFSSLVFHVIYKFSQQFSSSLFFFFFIFFKRLSFQVKIVFPSNHMQCLKSRSFPVIFLLRMMPWNELGRARHAKENVLGSIIDIDIIDIKNLELV